MFSAIESNVNRNDFTELSTRCSISVELGFLNNLLVISTDNTGLNVIGIISLNLATALSGRHLENLFFICGIYSDNQKSIKRLLNYGLIELDYGEVLLVVQF